jgi:hypothetical protein
MRIRHVFLWSATVLVFMSVALGQGFVNLNFEQATIAPTPVGGWTYPADPAQCFPGWTVGSGVVAYNDLSLGSPANQLYATSRFILCLASVFWICWPAIFESGSFSSSRRTVS